MNNDFKPSQARLMHEAILAANLSRHAAKTQSATHCTCGAPLKLWKRTNDLGGVELVRVCAGSAETRYAGCGAPAVELTQAERVMLVGGLN